MQEGNMHEEMETQPDRTPTMLTRRDLLRWSLLAGAASMGAPLLAGCTTATPASPTTAPTSPAPTSAPAVTKPKGDQLAVQTWSGSYEAAYSAAVMKPFEKEFGVKVISVASTGESYSLAKIKQEVDSGDPKVDVSTQLPGDVARGKAMGIFEKLNLANLPNLADIFDQAKDKDGYAVGYLVYNYGICYSRAIPKPTSWEAMWDPQWKKKISIGPGHATYFIQTVNLLLNGKLSPVNLDEIFAKLEKLTPNILTFGVDAQARNLLVNKETVMAPLFNGRVAMMQVDALEVEFSGPKEGTLAAPDFFAITKNTKVKDLAEAFINFSLAPKQQEAVAAALFYAPTNKKAKLTDKLAAMMPYGEAAWKGLFFEDAAYVAAQTDAWNERWNKWKAGIA
jgi:putative spermidine/putrescine transport system substrate-binding protein